VDGKVAEHALAHVPPGVDRVYDRHHCLPEKPRRSRSWPNWSTLLIFRSPEQFYLRLCCVELITSRKRSNFNRS
jgi:hypothetical protein